MNIIFSEEIENKRSRLTKYVGVDFADSSDDHGYLKNSYVPRGAALALTDRECSDIASTKYTGDLGNSIFLIKIFDKNKIFEFDSCLAKNKAVLNELVQAIQKKVKLSGAIHPIGLCTTRDSQKTITKEFKSFFKVGLHIDSWDSAKLSNRSFGSNRLVLNLGPTSRNFLFLNKSVELLVKERPAYRDEYEGKSLVLNYFEQYPDANIYSLQINPGEAYIAPTENLIHDATVPGNHQLNTTFMLRGMIEPKEIISEVFCHS